MLLKTMILLRSMQDDITFINLKCIPNLMKRIYDLMAHIGFAFYRIFSSFRYFFFYFRL